MVIATYILLIILSLLFPKSKKVTYLILVFMWVVGTFCYGHADESIYFSRYTAPDLWKSYTEYGFAFIIQACRILNFSFVGFKGIVFLIETILVGNTVIRYSKHPKLVLLLFIICPYPLFVVQMRSSLAASIMVFSCRYLLDLPINKKTNYIKYSIGIVCATLIHTSALLWMLLLVAGILNTRKTIIFTVVSSFVICFIVTPFWIAKIISCFGAVNRIGQYLTSAYADSEWRHFGPAVYIVYVATFTLLFLYYCQNKTVYNKVQKIEMKQLNLIKKINIIMLVLLSIILKYTSEVTRIQEGFMVVNYVYITNCINLKKFSFKKLSVSNMKRLTLIIAFILIYTYLMLIHYLMDLVWIPFWVNNSFLNL